MTFVGRLFAFSSVVFPLIIVGCGGSEETAQTETNTNVNNREKGQVQEGVSGDRKQSQPDIPTFEFKYETPTLPQTVEEADAFLTALKEKYDSTNIPRNLNPPFSRDAAMEFVKAIVVLKDSVEGDAKALESIVYEKLTGADAGNTRYFNSQQKSTLSRLQDYAPKEIEQSIKLSRESLKMNANFQLKFLERGATVDMSDRSAIATHLSDMLVKQRNEEFIRTLDVIDVAMFFDAQFGKGDQDYKKLKEQVLSWQIAHDKNLAKAGDSVLPPKGIDDSELMKIAQNVLANEKYELPKAKRTIVVTRKKPQNRIEYSIEDDKVIRIERRWQEFQVATIEKHDGKHYIYFNTLKYFTKGHSTTPLEKWVLGERFRSAPINESNIEK